MVEVLTKAVQNKSAPTPAQDKALQAFMGDHKKPEEIQAQKEQARVQSQKNLQAESEWNIGIEEAADLGLSSQPQKTEAQKVKNSADIAESINIASYVTASLLHLGAAFTNQFKGILPDFMARGLDKSAPILSKAVNSINSLQKGFMALKDRRSFDALARFAYPLIVPWMPVEEMYQATGISSGLAMWTDSQKHYLKNKEKSESLVTDFFDNIRVNIKLLKEMFTGLFTKDRKLFVSQAKDEGHTMALGGHLNFMGAAICLADKFLHGTVKSVGHVTMLRRLGLWVRNIGSGVADYAKLIHPDKNHQRAAIGYVGTSAFDIAQGSTSDSDKANTLSHLSQAIGNIANYFYINTTKATTDGDFKTHDLQMAAV